MTVAVGSLTVPVSVAVGWLVARSPAVTAGAVRSTTSSETSVA